jgi:hypothetical protein
VGTVPEVEPDDPYDCGDEDEPGKNVGGEVVEDEGSDEQEGACKDVFFSCCRVGILTPLDSAV